jgi:hypothetical protein
MVNKNSLIIFAATSLLLLGIANASPTNCATFSALNATIINNALNKGLALSLMALLFTINVYALGYIISRLVTSQSLKGIINAEYFELAKSAIIIVSIIFVLTLISNIAVILNGSVSGSYVNNIYSVASSANSYLCSTQTAINSGVTGIVGLSEGIAMIRSLTISYAVPIPLELGAFLFGIQFRPYTSSILESRAGDAAFATNSFINDMIDIIVLPMLYIITFEMVLLPDLILLGLAVFIPIGLVFRTFPVFRPIGGMFIALGIGLAIIFPAVLALFNAPVSNMIISASGSNISINAPTGCSSCNWLFKAVYDFFSNEVSYIKSLGIAFESINSIYPALNSLMYYNLYMLFQFLLFIFDLAIIIPIVSYIAEILGGKLTLGIGGKLKIA